MYLSITSIFQKAARLKDAMLNSINVPAYAMWKDEGFGIPNNALLKLMPRNGEHTPGDQRLFHSQYTVWTEDFNRELGLDEFPIVELCRGRQRFHGRRIGMKHLSTGARMVFDPTGKSLLRDGTEEFLGGLVIFRDVTEYTTRIAAKIEENERQFKCIANFIPAIVRTTMSTDWFSQRWYDYTGLTTEQSLRDG